MSKNLTRRPGADALRRFWGDWLPDEWYDEDPGAEPGS